MKTPEETIKALNLVLCEQDPEYFSSTWINENIPQVYRCIHKHIRDENNYIDWDRITSKLDRKFKKDGEDIERLR